MGKTSGIIQSYPQLSSPPTTPASGYSIIYPRSDNRWYIRNSDGTEFEITNSFARTAVADAAYTILTTDKYIGLSSITASRIFTLPAASTVNAGHELIIADESGSVTAGITLTINRAGSDTIDGATSEVITSAYGFRRLISDGTSKWTFDGGIVRLNATQTLTNKTLTSPVINTPTGIVKGDIGLGSVDNTADSAKPVSTAQQTALDLKANLASPALTGTPTAPTATPGTNTTQIATTAFATIAGAPETATSIGTLLNSLTAKTTPVDADYMGLMDSAASNIWKKLSWANLKATAKTYFDTLYQATLGYTAENTANKGASGGYPGLTLFKINFRNAANTFISFFTNSNTAARTYTFQDRDGTIADDTDLGLKVDKSAAAYTMRANNTSGTANVADQTFKDVAEQTYSGTIAWTGTTAPSGTTGHTYQWTQVGKMVTLRLNLRYSVAGAALTLVVMDLPSDCPTVKQPTGATGNNSMLYTGYGFLGTSENTQTTIQETRLKNNATNTGFQIVIAQASAAMQYAYATVTYWTT